MTTTELQTGTIFAGHHIEAEIGRGGMGVVYRARDLSLERPVALKLIAPELASDEGFRKRFLKESRLAASLDHPHVLPVFAAGEEAGQLYLATRYVEGEDLKTLLRREHKLSPERALRICSQVAEALDAAHRRGLVHRDVKPANVLLDESGEAYLADFGLTKQVGGASTETGQLVGTLDYLAPEQIRGEEVDGRTDEYALACVLYECLEGQAPFHRSTEAELLWAHMQEPAPALAAYPSLDPVFARALAKENKDRYESPAAFCEAAAQALGLETPRLRRRRRLLRRSRLLIAAGVLVLAGAAVAVAVASTRGRAAERATAAANSLVAIDPATGRIDSVIDVGRTPSAVAVGEGAVWTLNVDDHTVSKIDAHRKQVVGTFGIATAPTDLAVGDGAVWVASSGLMTSGSPALARIDPGTGAVVASLRPSPGSIRPRTVAPWPQRGIAIGTSGIWLSDPLSGVIWKIDPRTNRVRLRLSGISARSLVSTPHRLWLANPDGSVQALAASGRKTQRVGLKTTTLDDVAYGAGAVWALDRPDGLLWRIDPGPRPVSRTIQVGFGASSIAYGHGSVWVTNSFDGTILRVDPSTNRVVQTVKVGGVPTAVAVGYGRVWAAVSGAGPLRASSCGPVVSGAERKPDFLIASDFPLQFTARATTTPAALAVELVMREHGFRAGRFTLGYQSCDDSVASSAGSDPYKCLVNARSYAADPSVIGVVGPLNSPCATIEVPITSRATLPVVSPSNSWPGLTRAGPGAAPGEPGKYYPTGVRSYFRVSSTDADEAAAGALLAKQLGARRVFVLRLFEPGLTSDWPLAMSTHFEYAARKLGLTVVGSSRWQDDPRRYDKLVARVGRTHPDVVYLGGWLCESCGELVEKLRAQLGRRVVLIAPDGFDPSATRASAGNAAVGMYVSVNEAPVSALPPAGRRFAREFARLHPELENGEFPPWVPYAAQSTEALLAAIARSDGTRASVVRELHHLRVVNGPLGSFRFDRFGDATVNYTTIVRITKEPSPESPIPGADLDRVLTVPRSLTR